MSTPTGYEQKLYLENSTLYSSITTIVSCIELNESNSSPNTLKHGTHKIVVNQTIFHPQGGGQPSDIGIITLDKNGNSGNSVDDGVFQVNYVQYGTDGSIEHIGQFINANNLPWNEGWQVILTINEEKRVLHKKLHSAGHVIDAAVRRIGYWNSKLTAGKGYHFPDGPYVEYIGELTDEELTNLTNLLQQEIDRIIHENILSKFLFVTKEEAGQLCECDTSTYPEIVRVVEIAGNSCPCGGTHIDMTNELTGLQITRIKKKKKNVKISYEIVN